MTPQQRADAYWQAQRNAEDCSLVEWFKRCENEALDRARKMILVDCRGVDIAEKEFYTPLAIEKAAKIIEGLKH